MGSQRVRHKWATNTFTFHLNSKINSEEKEQSESIPLPDFKSYHKATVSETSQHWQKKRYIEQWNSIEGTKITSCTYGQLIYDKRAKNILWRKVVSSIIGVRKTGQSTCREKKKKETRPLSHSRHKIQLKMDQILEYKTWNYKTPRRKHRQYALWRWS